jgi:hypothetical protein
MWVLAATSNRRQSDYHLPTLECFLKFFAALGWLCLLLWRVPQNRSTVFNHVHFRRGEIIHKFIRGSIMSDQKGPSLADSQRPNRNIQREEPAQVYLCLEDGKIGADGVKPQTPKKETVDPNVRILTETTSPEGRKEITTLSDAVGSVRATKKRSAR